MIAGTPSPLYGIARNDCHEGRREKKPPLPTVTLTMAPLAKSGHKDRSEVVVTAAAITRDEELIIAPISQRESSNDWPPHAMLEK
jgi:hypothetical protein